MNTAHSPSEASNNKSQYHNNLIDPNYVQIGRAQSAQIIGRSPSEFDRLRREDPRCPKAIKTGDDRMSKVLFVLAEVYAFSEILIEEGKERVANAANNAASKTTP